MGKCYSQAKFQPQDLAIAFAVLPWVPSRSIKKNKIKKQTKKILHDIDHRSRFPWVFSQFMSKQCLQIFRWWIQNILMPNASDSFCDYSTRNAFRCQISRGVKYSQLKWISSSKMLLQNHGKIISNLENSGRHFWANYQSSLLIKKGSFTPTPTKCIT